MSLSSKIRVGVLRGGPSHEYDVSLKTGGSILANLEEDYTPIDIFISKDGTWHLGGFPRDPQKILRGVDMVVNALHGAYGEDGTVQKILEHFGTPYTGSNAVASAVTMNKKMTKDILSSSVIKTPHYMVIEKDVDEIGFVQLKNMVEKIYRNVPFPIIIKPINIGSSLGVSYVDNKIDIKQALLNAFQYSTKVLVEEYIDGKEVTCGVIDGFRGRDIYTLMPVLVEKDLNKKVHDYHSKYLDINNRHTISELLSPLEKIQVQEVASLAHKNLGLRDYSRSDMIIHPKRGIFLLEVNALPEITHRSSFIKSLESLGGSMKEFLNHLIDRTLKRR